VASTAREMGFGVRFRGVVSAGTLSERCRREKGVFDMDDKLNSLWLTGQYPFNQLRIDMEDIIELTKLHQCLNGIANYLFVNFSSEVINLNHDWHEHDGYINNSQVISWDSYLNNMRTIESLFVSRDGDTYVRIAIYPENLGFILRYYILEEDEDDLYPGIWGTFDITIDQKHLRNIMGILDVLEVNYKVSKSKEIFDRTYSG
jgi:hypothetical protein